MAAAKDQYLAALRNIGIAAHIDAGKTTVTERVLYYAGLLHRMGNVDDGNTVTDFLPEERERGITIMSAAVTVHWRDCAINIIDTPGHVDFTAEVERVMRVLDGAVIVFCGVGGVEAQSETVWRQADRYAVPRLCFVNKLDRPGSDFDRAVREIEQRFGVVALPLQFPLNPGSTRFDSLVNLVNMRVLRFVPESLGRDIEEQPIPSGAAEEAAARREMLLEALAALDDEFASLYLEEAELGAPAMQAALRRVVLARKGFVVLAGSALHNVGIQPLLDAVVHFLPSPSDIRETTGRLPESGRPASRKHRPDAPLSALAFKNVSDPYGELVLIRVYSGTLMVGKRFLNATRNRKERAARIYRIFADRREEVQSVRAGEIAALGGLRWTITGDTLTDEEQPIIYEEPVFPEPVVSMAVEPRTNADRDKLLEALRRLARQDPTLKSRENEETGELLLSGMGELHLEIIREFLERDFHVEARFGRPRVSYRERPLATYAGEGVLEQQVGGRPLYARVALTVKPIADTRSRMRPEWENEPRRAALPAEIVEALNEGIVAAAGSGPLMGEPIVGAVAVVREVDYDPARAQPAAFAAAAARAVEHALAGAPPRTQLLEPVMKIEVLTPEEYLGNIVRDLSVRQAQVTRTDVRGDLRLVEAFAALAGMFGYAGTLRSLSSGRAGCTMEPCDYRPVPQERVQRLAGL